MAKMTAKLPDDLIRKISSLGEKTDDICEHALKEGAAVTEKKIRDNLKSVIGKNTKVESRSTGELLSALGVTPVGIDKNGNYDIKIGFNEPRKDGSSNAKIANIIEYGKVGQPPRPFLKTAKQSSQRAAIDTIRKTLEEEINKL